MTLTLACVFVLTLLSGAAVGITKFVLTRNSPIKAQNYVKMRVACVMLSDSPEVQQFYEENQANTVTDLQFDINRSDLKDDLGRYEFSGRAAWEGATEADHKIFNRVLHAIGVQFVYGQKQFDINLAMAVIEVNADKKYKPNSVVVSASTKKLVVNFVKYPAVSSTDSKPVAKPYVSQNSAPIKLVLACVQSLDMDKMKTAGLGNFIVFEEYRPGENIAKKYELKDIEKCADLATTQIKAVPSKRPLILKQQWSLKPEAGSASSTGFTFPEGMEFMSAVVYKKFRGIALERRYVLVNKLVDQQVVAEFQSPCALESIALKHLASANLGGPVDVFDMHVECKRESADQSGQKRSLVNI